MYYPLPRINGAEALSPGDSFDLIAPHPYSSNVRLDENGQKQPVLSVLSRIVLDASVKAWEAHPESKLIIARETCYPGLPTTTDLMVERALETSDIPEEAIIPLNTRPDGRGYNNTYLQTSGLVDYIAEQDPGAATLSVSLEYHIQRIMLSAKPLGYHALFVSAEDILHERGIHEYDKYGPVIAELENSERPLRALNRSIDPRGNIANTIQRIFGPRMVDVVETEAGLTLLNTTAKNRLDQIGA